MLNPRRHNQSKIRVTIAPVGCKVLSQEGLSDRLIGLHHLIKNRMVLLIAMNNSLQLAIVWPGLYCVVGCVVWRLHVGLSSHEYGLATRRQPAVWHRMDTIWTRSPLNFLPPKTRIPNPRYKLRERTGFLATHHL